MPIEKPLTRRSLLDAIGCTVGVGATYEAMLALGFCGCRSRFP